MSKAQSSLDRYRNSPSVFEFRQISIKTASNLSLIDVEKEHSHGRSRSHRNVRLLRQEEEKFTWFCCFSHPINQQIFCLFGESSSTQKKKIEIKKGFIIKMRKKSWAFTQSGGPESLECLNPAGRRNPYPLRSTARRLHAHGCMQ